jgi:branched-chain amino acid transport system permease protein
MLQAGVVPTTVWLLVGLGVAVTVVDGVPAAGTWPIRWPGGAAAALPCGLPLAPGGPGPGVVVPMGPQMYRLAYQPIASAPILILLIVSVAVHLAMVGLGLLFFGAEGRAPAFSEAASSSAR